MDIENHTPSIRETGLIACIFFGASSCVCVVGFGCTARKGLAEINRLSQLSFWFNCSCYVLVLYREKCDDNQITDQSKTAPLTANPVSAEQHNGGCYE